MTDLPVRALLARFRQETYEIRLGSPLTPDSAPWLDGFSVTSGDGESLIRGPISDQEQLYNLLAHIRAQHLPLWQSSRSNRTWKTCLSRSWGRGNEMSTTTAFRSPPPHTGEQGATGRPGPWVVAATRAVLNETQKGPWLLWGHRTVVLLEILGSVAFYPFLQFVIGNGTIQRALVRSTLLPFLAFPLLYLAILKLVSDLLEEVNGGTFEQMHLSPFSPAALLVGRLLAVFLEGLLIAVVLGVGMSWALGVSIPLRAAGLLPAALTLIDIAGFALLIGGLALSLPQIGAIAHLFGGLILLLNGAFVPLEWFPGWLQTLARSLPSTLGVQATRQVVLQGQSLGSVWADGALPWLLIHAALFALLGVLVFLLNDRRARRLGTLR